MRRLVFANLFSRVPQTALGGSALEFSTMEAGQQMTVALRFVDEIGESQVEVQPDIAAIRAALGYVDRRPETGTWKLQVGAGASTGANTTGALDWNISESALAAALNALSGGTADYQVSIVQGSFLIRRTGGEAITLTVRENKLRPVAFGRVRAWQQDGAWIHDLRLIQSPLAWTSSAEQVLPDAPTVTAVRDGGPDPSGTFIWNEIQALTLPADFRGLYHLKRDYARTPLLSQEDGAEEIAAALNKLLESENASVAVTNPATNTAHIEFLGDLSGINVDLLEVAVFSSPPGDWTFTLDLNTAELWDALRESDELTGLRFEVEVDIYIDPDDHDAGTQTVKLWSVEMPIRRPVVWEGLAAAATIDWLRGPSPRDYVPFTLDQVLTGQQQAFSSVVGDGVATEFELDHNLDSELAQIVVRENSAPGRLLRPDEYGVTVESSNTITVDFAAGANAYGAPTASELVVYVVAIGPESVFQTHTHTIGQITDLEDILDDLGDRVTSLEAILPSTGPAATANSGPGLITVIPEVSEVLFYKGEEELFTDNGVDTSLLNAKRATVLLPAVHDGTLTDPLPDPLPAAAAGTVWVAGARTLIPGAGGVRSAYVENDGFVASDGRSLYVASRDGTTNSYYPQAFERTLWAMAINDKMLAVNRTLEIAFGVQAQLIHATCKAQWVLSIQVGTFSAETTPSTVGLNLETVTWASPVFSQAIVLSRLAQSHFFGVRIKRASGGFSLDQQLYGVWGGNDASAPASANFAIRARLDRFDTENRDDPRGYLAWKLIGSLEIAADGKQTTQPAQAKIF